MLFKGLSIRQKLRRVIMVTAIAVLSLTCSALFIYEYVAFRQTSLEELSALGRILASNSTAALAFKDDEAADEILSALKNERHIVAACLYNEDGIIFSKYPVGHPDNYFPRVEETVYRFQQSYLEGFEIVKEGDRKLGTLYIRSDMDVIYNRFRLYGVVVLGVIVLSVVLAYFISDYLQNSVSKPVLNLAETARAVSEKQDYGVRATKLDDDELGVLTDTFNHMLDRLQVQTAALVESNDRIQSIINSALSAVIVMDSSGRIQDWNKRAESIFGWTRSEIIGRELADTIVPEKYREAHRMGLTNFIKTGKSELFNKLIEMSAVRRDGSEFPVDLLISTLRTDNVLSFCGFVTDITERKRAEAEILSFNQKLEQLVTERTRELQSVNSELESFSYSISHDLRAPLRSIHGYMNILAEEYGPILDHEGKRLVGIILKNGQRMGQLIDDLLEFSRLGRKELNKSDVSMNDLVSLIIEDQKKQHDDRTIEIKLLPLPGIKADHGTIQQVWINLISNAIKYSRKQEKTLIEIGSIEEPEEITYYVTDNGAGFDMKYYDKLFGVFQRLHSTSEFEGTGVGLAIVHRIVVRHGGRIWAKSKVNEGSTFFFSIKKE